MTRPAGGFGSFEEFGEGVGGAVALLFESFGGREGHGEHVGEAAVVGLHPADAFDVAAEPSRAASSTRSRLRSASARMPLPERAFSLMNPTLRGIWSTYSS